MNKFLEGMIKLLFDFKEKNVVNQFLCFMFMNVLCVFVLIGLLISSKFIGEFQNFAGFSIIFIFIILIVYAINYLGGFFQIGGLILLTGAIFNMFTLFVITLGFVTLMFLGIVIFEIIQGILKSKLFLDKKREE